MRYPDRTVPVKRALLLGALVTLAACEASGGYEHEPCVRNEDCRRGANGRCLTFDADLVTLTECVYDACRTNAQCPSRHVCGSIAEEEPGQTNLACLRSTCTPGTACPDGEPCALRLQTSTGGLFTPRPDDYLYACGDDICGASAPISEYRITTLLIPTMADVTAGSAIGHNVDSVGDTCGVTDFSGGVDNAFMTLSAGLLGLAPPLDLQAELDAALLCTTPSSSCEPLELSLVIQECGTTVFSIRGSEGATLTTRVPEIIDASGRFRVQFPALPLSIPVRTPTGVAPLAFTAEHIVISGTATNTGVDDLVIGAVVRTDAMLDAFALALAELPDGPSMEDVETAAGPSDVQLENVCAGHSLGLRAVARLQEDRP